MGLWIVLNPLGVKESDLVHKLVAACLRIGDIGFRYAVTVTPGYNYWPDPHWIFFKYWWFAIIKPGLFFKSMLS